jgi:hypothetical protein
VFLYQLRWAELSAGWIVLVEEAEHRWCINWACLAWRQLLTDWLDWFSWSLDHCGYRYWAELSVHGFWLSESCVREELT